MTKSSIASSMRPTRDTTRDAHSSHGVGVYSDDDGSAQAAAMIGAVLEPGKEEIREDPMKSERDGINPAAEPSGTGCVERSSRASVGSIGARTGWSGAFKLANAASRIGCPEIHTSAR